MLKIITPPTAELITVAEAADFMRVDFPDSETTQIETMITAARQWCEDYLRRAIGIQTLEEVLGAFPKTGRQAINLRPPVISITSVIYTDTSGDDVELVEGTDYYVALDSEPGEIVPISAWPVALAKANSVKVRYQAGYSNPGDSPLLSTALPTTIRTAMLMQIMDLYENRGSQTERPLTVNQTLERLLSMHRLEMGI